MTLPKRRTLQWESQHPASRREPLERAPHWRGGATAKRGLGCVLRVEARSALEDLFLDCVGIPKPEQGHFILPEKGNPRKRVVGRKEFLRTERGREGSGAGQQSRAEPPLPGKSPKSFPPR